MRRALGLSACVLLALGAYVVGLQHEDTIAYVPPTYVPSSSFYEGGTAYVVAPMPDCEEDEILVPRVYDGSPTARRYVCVHIDVLGIDGLANLTAYVRNHVLHKAS